MPTTALASSGNRGIPAETAGRTRFSGQEPAGDAKHGAAGQGHSPQVQADAAVVYHGLEECGSAVSRSGLRVTWLALLALDELRAGRYEEADVLSRVAVAESEITIANKLPLAEDGKTWALHSRGVVLVEIGRFEEAIPPLRESLVRLTAARGESDTVVGGAYLALGSAYRGTRQDDEAQRMFERAALAVRELCAACKLETEAVLRRHCEEGYTPACQVHAEHFRAAPGAAP